MIFLSLRSPSSKSFHTYVISFRTRHYTWACGRGLSTKFILMIKFLEKSGYQLKIAEDTVWLLLREADTWSLGENTFHGQFAYKL